MELATLAERLSNLPPSAGNAVVVAIDGGGGAGKSTFAAALAAVWKGSELVRTDDFASWDNPLDWWPRLIDQVLGPLARGETVRYQQYDWENRDLGEWITLDAARVILEGVSSSRREFRPYLGFRIWIDCPRELRLARGLVRDGEGMREQWTTWMAAEDLYFDRDRPRDRADLVVSGV